MPSFSSLRNMIMITAILTDHEAHDVTVFAEVLGIANWWIQLELHINSNGGYERLSFCGWYVFTKKRTTDADTVKKEN